MRDHQRVEFYDHIDIDIQRGIFFLVGLLTGIFGSWLLK